MKERRSGFDFMPKERHLEISERAWRSISPEQAKINGRKGGLKSKPIRERETCAGCGFRGLVVNPKKSVWRCAYCGQERVVVREATHHHP